MFNTPPTQTIHVAASDYESQPMTLGVSKSVVIDLPRDIKDVLVADPKIANAVVRSSRRAFIIGSTVGQTNVFFFDAEGKQIAGFDIAVTRDLNGIRQAIHQVLPDADITVEGIGDGVVLSGQRVEPGRGAAGLRYRRAAARRRQPGCRPNGSKIVNAIVVRGRDQIMLKVVVAEVERDVIKQLGINLSGSLNYGTAVVNFNNTNPFSASGQSLSGSSITGGFNSVSATLQAMEQAGVIHTLAEPNLTAISGESATFVAGGEFPVLNGYSCSTATTGSTAQTCQPSIDFKKFGVSLNFTPVVLSEGRISLKVMTEVSDLSTQNSLTITEPGSNADRDHSLDPHPPRRDHGGNSVRRLAGHGRHDPELDQAGDQRPARLGGASHSRTAVQEPRLHQSANRADGAGDALCRARGRPEGFVAPRRRFRRSERSRRRCCSAGSTASTASAAIPSRPTATTANTASSSIDAAAGDDDAHCQAR